MVTNKKLGDFLADTTSTLALTSMMKELFI
jgi:hypothetical protein